MSVYSTREALPRIQSILAEGRPCHLVVTGSSMWPFLRSRKDAVILVPADRAPKPDDILIYLRREDFCVLHRVIRREESGLLILCGDAQIQGETVRPEQIIALVSHIQRGGRLISCEALPWRFFSRLWRWLLPVRAPLLRLGRLAAGLKRRILDIFSCKSEEI